jgi:P-type Ca2+ transporter type 2C
MDRTLGFGPSNLGSNPSRPIKMNKVKNFHSLSIDETLKELESNEKGLNEKQVKERRDRFGVNEIQDTKGNNFFFIFLKQFRSFLIYVLFFAAIISLIIGHLIDFGVIVAVIIINAGIGFVQEFKAEKSVKALKKLVITYAKVYRKGNLIKIPAKDLVPGDILYLEEGDKIPADSRLIQIKNFKTMESSLTGESLSVQKNLDSLPEKVGLADRKNMVFMGTFVSSGSAKAVVVFTGPNTFIGSVAEDIKKIKPVKSHFKEISDKLAKQMAFIAFLGSLIIFSIGYFFRDFDFFEIFQFTLASLVSGIPEGLPAVLTIVLAVGAYRMSKRNAILKDLPSTETLGVVNVIITDKTGTITENTMNIEKIIVPGQSNVDVSGKGWEPIGVFSQSNKEINVENNAHLSKIISISALCNNSNVLKNDLGNYEVLGDPTEASFSILTKKAGWKNLENEKRIDDLPFNPELKYRASLSTLIGRGSKKQVYVIGAPEAVLNKSKYFLKNNNKKILSEKEKNNLLKEVEGLTKSSMRVLALAYKNVDSSVEKLSEDIVGSLVVVGFVGIRDPPKEEVEEAIRKAKKAGIRVVMVTGDHGGTALSIAQEVGLAKDSTKVYLGNELEEMSDKKFREVILKNDVFARLTPSIKLKIAEELQKQGNIVAMTGDGVNDAPALKKADIGISMGIMGTDVARESSKIILTDDNFASIVNAIEEGRIVFLNTKRSASFLITTSFAENISIVATLVLGLPLPLTVTQILWLNLVTDGVTDVALALEPGHNDVLNKKPRRKSEGILTKQILPFLILISVLMVLLTVGVFYFHIEDIDKARTAAFVVMAFTQLFNSFNMRSFKNSVFKLGFFSNKFLNYAIFISFCLIVLVIYIPFTQEIFNFVSISFYEFSVLFLLSFLVLVFGEIYKKLKIRKSFDNG